ncbi:discoidin domain-containing protein [Microbacterium sp. ZW T5_45]|uniref:discoidin domain-containing protein n=1 Tax=Microbacterium sp. ZW T5_45 TaxID=3378080 RepID=UPI003853F54B
MTAEVAIERVTEAGFTHPGIGITADALEATRTQLLAGADPWASFFNAMKATKYASRTLTSTNQGAGDGVPLSDAFADAGMNSRLDADGAGAQTQALLYFLTGDPVYRENALKIVRIWSHMDPEKYEFYPDAQIKIGGGAYRLIQAAELLRYTSVVDGGGGYPLEWTGQDTDDFTENFIEPVTATFAYSNAWYMNQGTLPMLASMSGAIFTNNQARYNERVEWFTVNASHPDQDVNGSVAAMFRLIDKNDPLNPFNKSFVQHVEMGRDQAHAADDVLTLTALARMVDTQGTKLDPKTGVPSTKKGAVTPYRFLSDRLLKGANAFVGFTMGYDVPWIDITDQGGRLAQSYRGRGPDALNELYHIYTYDERVNVADVAPYVAKQFEQRDGAYFYNWTSHEIGTKIADDGLYSFWGGSIPGDDYWLSIPVAAKGESVPAADQNLQFEAKGAVIAGKASVLREGDQAFLRASVKKNKDTTIAVRNLLYGPRDGFSPVALRVRTTETSTLSVSSQRESEPYHRFTVPNTGGQWRYVTYDMDTSVIPKAVMGDNNIVFLTLSGTNTSVDLDYLDADASTEVTPPRFPQGSTTTLIGVVGQPLDADLAADNEGTGETLTYSTPVAPNGLVVDSSAGRLTWIPRAKQGGDTVAVVQADDGATATALAVTIRIAQDRAGALALAKDGYDTTVTYTSVSRSAYDTAVEAAQKLVKTGSYRSFADALVKVQNAVRGLEPLTPLLGDGTLDYLAVSTSTLDANLAATLADDDNTTFAGDLTVPSFTFDFGPGYRVKADAFELQARQTFGNRSQGTNVYGSNDGTTWTKLTTRMTTNTNDRETLPVGPSQADTAYRLIKVQVDEPGVATDPNFPGIFSIGEFRIHGERVESVNRVTTASITSNNPIAGIAATGDVVALTFATTEPITDVEGTIQGAPAEITGAGTSWKATATVPSDVIPGSYISFKVTYKTAAGQVADPLQLTTDQSRLFLSDTTGLITAPTSLATIVSTSGEPEPSKQTWVNNMFDTNAATFSDVGPVGGKYYVILDFGDGGSLALDHAELLVRQDSWGSGRASNLHLEGSNDLATWKPVSYNAKATLDWQLLKRPAGTAVTPYRYLKVANTDWINIAELRLFGSHTAPAASSISTAKITSSGGDVGGRAVEGDTVTLSFTAKEPITDVTATIDGKAATVTGSGTSWTATASVTVDASPSRKLGFRVDYAGPAGEDRPPLVATTDGSSVFLTTDEGLITDVTSKSTAILLNGTPNADKQLHVNRLFDHNVSTFSDSVPVDGPYLVMDFGAGHAIGLDHAELIVRQDAFGTGRAGDVRLEGSNDLATWTRLTDNAKGTLAWQTLAKSSAAPSTEFRYIRVANNDWINIAELRLFGTHQ